MPIYFFADKLLIFSVLYYSTNNELVLFHFYLSSLRAFHLLTDLLRENNLKKYEFDTK